MVRAIRGNMKRILLFSFLLSLSTVLMGFSSSKAKAATESDFEIKDGVLIKYRGNEENVIIPESVTEIGQRAFSENKKITSVTIPDTVTSIGDWAFSFCRKLTEIRLSDNLTMIGKGAFFRTRLKNVTIPGSVTVIGDIAFEYCDKLRWVIISEGVQTIGSGAFSGCILLEKVSIPSTVTAIGRDAFHNDNLLLHIDIDPSNTVYTSKFFFILSKDGKTLLQCARTQGSIYIPQGVEETGEGVFYHTDIEEIEFPRTMKKLYDNLFYNCTDLSVILLPSSLTSFGEQSFEFCRDLKEINVYEDNKEINYTSENGVLYSADKSILICDPTAGSTVVADDVRAISNYAFPNADVSVTIPISVREIADNAFNLEMLWKPANESPFYVYGFSQSVAEEYCRKKGIEFKAFDRIYNINYKLDGGTNHIDNPTTYSYYSDEIILKEPNRKGYKFLYWYEDISICEDGCCRGERIVKSIPQKSMGNIELIAKWEIWE